jgi:putative aminopeptidase FrvX
MDICKKELLKEILSIPACFANEDLVREFLVSYGTKNSFIVSTDKKGNVYFTKGELNDGEFYPCVGSHMDTVYTLSNTETCYNELILKNLRKDIVEENGIIKALHPVTKERIGLGADDLAGVYACVEMMNKFDKIKSVFFVEEEFGCNGSYGCDKKFFEDVGYFLGFDAPTGNWYSQYSGSVQLFDNNFDEIVKPILETNNIDNYSFDPFCDVMAIKEQFDFCCANLPVGYHHWHTKKEYLNIAELEKGIEIGTEFIVSLGNKKHIFKQH